MTEKNMLFVGDKVLYNDEEVIVNSIRKCQPDGHCIYGLNGIFLNMMTDKIEIIVGTSRGMKIIKGTQVIKVEVN